MKTPSRIADILIAQRAPVVITRRGFIIGGAALAGGLASPQLWAQRTQPAVRSLRGLVRVNGERATSSAPIGAGDTVSTGPDGHISFVVGGDAFFLRENSELKMEAASAGRELIGALRMVTGALGAVFGKRRSGRVTLATPTVTAGIRGTGCYTEVRDEGVYFCTCFGAIELTSGNGQQELVVASHHDARMVMRDAGTGSSIIPSSVGRHTDTEMDGLEKLVGRRAPWIGTPDEHKPYPPGA